MGFTIQASQSFGQVAAGSSWPSVKEAVSSVVEEVSFLGQKVVEFGSNVVADCARGSDFAAQWIRDYSNCSSGVRQSADKVKNVADQVNVFGSFCDTVLAVQDLFEQPIKGVSDAINLAGGCWGASMDLTGRLAGLNVISLGSAQTFVDGTGAIADSLCGLNGAREVIQSPESIQSIPSALLKVAKNVALAVFASLAGISSCFAKAVAGWTSLPMCVLIAGTAFLSLKLTSNFYDRLMLPRPPGLLGAV